MATIRVLVEIDREAPASAEALGAAPELPAGLPALPGLEVDDDFGTVPMGLPAAVTESLGVRPQQRTSIIRGEADRDAIDALRAGQQVVEVYSDPEIAPVASASLVTNACGPLDCDPGSAKGDRDDIAEALGIQALWDEGYRGQGVVIGIVDGGVDADKYPVIGGWSPIASSPPGVASHWDEHGNMCAFDSLIAASEAKLYDLGIGKAPGGMSVFLSAALQSFQLSLNQFRVDGTPQVLSNSWGLYQDAWDPFPPGNPGNYTHNSNHPFTRKAVEVMDEGILVAFAAGNCGDPCPAGRCGPDHGPGRSIRGANGHERVICCGAANRLRQRIGYSSEGPATLFDAKPDLCGYSHFEGHFPVDTGTSAATPVVAGVLATLRSRFPGLHQDRARRVLNETAINICAPGFDSHSGYGVVNPPAAYTRLKSELEAGLPEWLLQVLKDLGVVEEVLRRAPA